MLNKAVDLMRQVMPSDGELKLLNRFQYRALKPTWPVAFSLLFLSLAFLVPDQGRAIIKYTINKVDLNMGTPLRDIFETLFTIGFFIVHGVAMMYTAFMLSAVTRRSQIDSQTDNPGSARSDPVDPSITLRLRYAYICGVFLPLQFMLMALWFRYGLLDPEFWAVVAIGVVIGVACTAIAARLYRPVSRRLALYSRQQDRPGLGDNIRYSCLSTLQFCFTPEHRKAQAAIVGLFAVLTILLFLPDMKKLVGVDVQTDGADLAIQFVIGAWMFFVSFICLHLIYRYYKDRVVKLHYGHTARYIIIDPTIDASFRWIRRVGIIAIPFVFWIPDFVDFLGPLGVGLFGTLWVTLFFSGLVESSARHARANSLSEVRREQQSFSLKSWFFLTLVGLLFIDLLIASAENLLFDKRFSIDMLIFVMLLGAFILHKRIWPDKSDFRLAVNRLPSSSVLAPILLLGLGEAHHIHRLDVGPATAPVPVLSIDDHAKAWLAAREVDNKPIPAIVVLAEGGGIRAGAHAGYYLSALDDKLRHTCGLHEETQNGARENKDRLKEEGLEVLCRHGADTQLLDHVYSINGVSGGSVGSAVYLAAVKDELSHGLSIQHRQDIIDATLSADYLAPLFAGLFGSDMLTTIVPAQLLDRTHGLFAGRESTDGVSAKFERGIFDRADFFENRLASIFDNALRSSLQSQQDQTQNVAAGCASADGVRTLDQSLELVAHCAVQDRGDDDPGPMVFFSTFYETGGYQMTTANVDITNLDDNNDAQAIGEYDCGSVPVVQQLLQRKDPRDRDATPTCDKRTQTLPLSTAAHLSARFPVSNPTGVIETRNEDGKWKRHYFVDGGYMDNSGSLTAIQALEALREAANGNGKDEKGYRVNVIVIHLYALGIPEDPAGAPGDDIQLRNTDKRATKQNEFTSIPSAVFKARGAASRAPIRLLCNSLLDRNLKNSSQRCDEIFARRKATALDANTFFTTKNFEDFKKENWPCPADPARITRIPLRELVGSEPQAITAELTNLDQAAPADSPEPGSAPEPDASAQTAQAAEPKLDTGLVAASWIPAPLEVAKSDSQDNAITALLGWTLLEETTTNMKKVMPGAADYTLTQLAEAVDGVDGMASRCAPPKPATDN